MVRRSLEQVRHQVLLDDPWFAGLPSALREDVLVGARERHLAEGESLYRRGDAPDGLYVVLEGAVRLGGVSRDGREALLDIFGPGTWFAEVSALDGLPRTHDATAHAPSRLMRLGMAELEQLQERHPAFTRHLLRLACQHMRLLLSGYEASAVDSLEQRMLSRVLTLADVHGRRTDQGVVVDLHLSQDLLAQLFGVSRQRVSQVLQKWRAQGLVSQRYGRLLLHERLQPPSEDA